MKVLAGISDDTQVKSFYKKQHERNGDRHATILTGANNL